MKIILNWIFQGIKSVWQWIKNVWQQIKKFFQKRFLGFAEGVVIVLFVVIFVLLIMRISDCGGAQWLDEGLGADGESNAKYQTLKSLALGLAGLVGLLGLFISNRRAKAQAEAVKAQAESVNAQVKDNENKTFHEAIKHLGDSSASVRLGGIYALYDLALSNLEKRLQNIIEILSSHVRETTQEKKYQEKYEKKPSNEISSLLKLLSNLNTKYLSENKKAESSPLDLSHACLCGVRLLEADFRKAFFIGSNFANADLEESRFEGAELKVPCFTGANLEESHFEGAKLRGSHFEGAHLYRSHFEGAKLRSSHFEGANLRSSYFKGAKLERSHFEGAKLRLSYFKSANLERSHFEGANLPGSHFEGANLPGSHFEGANLQESYFEVTNLCGSHFAFANLCGSHFEGAYDDRDGDIDDFMDRIQKRTGKEAEIGNTMVFSGGITGEYMKNIEKRVEKELQNFTTDDKREDFKKYMNEVIEALKKHQDQPVSHEIPEEVKDNNFLGELTEERANEILKQHEKSMKNYNKIIKKALKESFAKII